MTFKIAPLIRVNLSRDPVMCEPMIPQYTRYRYSCLISTGHGNGELGKGISHDKDIFNGSRGLDPISRNL